MVNFFKRVSRKFQNFNLKLIVGTPYEVETLTYGVNRGESWIKYQIITYRNQEWQELERLGVNIVILDNLVLNIDRKTDLES